MKIAIFASAFHPSLGGVEELCRQLAHVYGQKGHQVIVCTEKWPRALPAFERYEGIPVYRFPMRVPARGWKAKLNYVLTHRVIRSRLVRLLREQGIEVLHVQCVSTSAWYALYASKTLELPLVATLQGELGMDATDVFNRSPIHRKIMHTALREANAITACSRQTLREAETFHGTAFGERGKVVYNGINLRDFEEAEPHVHPRPYVLAIGRHVREKGFDVLLKAFGRAGDLGHDLILAGDGLENANLKALAAKQPNGDRVHFPGRVDHALAVRLFKGCSFFVLPSRHEPFGIVNLEAMAAGKAIAASRTGGVPEIVADGDNALLLPPEDPDALCAALRRLAGDEPLRTRLGESGGRRVRQFGWEELAEKYLEIYREAGESVRLSDRR